MELPIYKLIINESDDEQEVDCVSIVDRPAIESYAAYFSEDNAENIVEHKFEVISEEKNIIGGYLMIANKPIKRVDKDGKITGTKGKEFFVVLDSENIDKAMVRFYQRGYQNNVNLQHDPKRAVDGVTLYQHFIINREMGVKAPKGFKNEADGSSFGFFKVKNKEILELVKTNQFGFSIEGLFKQQPMVVVNQEEVEAIMKVLTK